MSDEQVETLATGIVDNLVSDTAELKNPKNKKANLKALFNCGKAMGKKNKKPKK